MNKSDLFIYVPAHLLAARLPFLINRKWQPEVACHEVQLNKLDFGQLGECAAQLHDHSLSTTLHAPFYDFNPGSPKRRLRKSSHKIADQSLQLAEKLGAKRIVFHPGLPSGSDTHVQQLWLKNSLEFWPEYLERAAKFNCILCIENIYEGAPELFIELLSTINSPHMGHVFDIGHWNIFSTRKLIDWLDITAPYLKHLHLHDNHGEHDEHLAVGQGYVPFSVLFTWLKGRKDLPTMTLENHSLPEVEISLKALEQYFS